MIAMSGWSQVLGVGAQDAAVDLGKLPVALDRQPDFLTEVRPLLEVHCYECHGTERQRSGLRLDIREAAMKGGDYGAAIVPGDGAASPLIWYVAHAVEGMEMPPKGEGLRLSEVGLLRAWIDGGAHWPDGVDDAELPDRTQHWAFQPVEKPAIPAVLLEEWPRNELDRFILARLEGEGLAPSPEADRATLIRRVTFNLHGLPPTPQAIDAFVSDPTPDAYERLVEQLLASPRYGERWARHWLDVVHYGETHGYDKDKPRPNAWPYRDYVIRSFNDDKPYARFVEEQLAGDVLYPDDPDGVVALGFIAAGPWDFVGHVELPESKSDGLIARYNDRDDMVMTAMSSFMSLTVHCARCHDHKFDPILQQEYYALQAVFAGVDRADRPYDANPAVHRRRVSLRKELASLQNEQGGLEKKLQTIQSDELTQVESLLKQKQQQLNALEPKGETSPSNGYHSEIASMPDVVKWVQVDLGESHRLDRIRIIPARPVDFPDTPGFGFPKRWRLEVSDEPTFENARVVRSHEDVDFLNPGDNSVDTELNEVLTARYVRMTATRLWERTQDYVFALGELQVFDGANNRAMGSGVTALDSIEIGRWSRAHLVDGYDSRKPLIDAMAEGELADVLDRVEGMKAEIVQLNERRNDLRLQGLTTKDRSRWNEIAVRLDPLRAELAALPKPSLVYAAAPEFKAEGNFRPPNGVRPVHFLRRGDVKSPGDLSEPGTLGFLPGLSGKLDVTPDQSEGERRAALARWLTTKENGLLRRSIVNRVWHYHFGRGLVETPNDFGHMGTKPSHPELLDWLAVAFESNGGSLKELHRWIVTSATYRQASVPSGSGTSPAEALRWRRAMALDADNHLLWRMNRQRLDAESLRDGLLQVSGQMDETMGGPSVQQFYFKDDHSPVYDYGRFDVDSAAAMRRSIYRFIVRSVPDPFMDTMDCPDPSVMTDRRNSTLTALQALALMNNAFVIHQAESLADQLKADADGIVEQVEGLFRRVLGREPAPDEIGQWALYIEQHGLANACRVMFNTNEFSFID
jgi:hypothetical protein